MDIKTPPKEIDFKNRPLIFLDLETSGLVIQKHEILEIGAVRVSPQKPFEIIEELEIKVRPKALELADKEALKVVKYSDKEWESSQELEEALVKLDQFGQDGVLVGYNVSTDWAFLDKAYFKMGRSDPFYYHRLDVMPMFYLKCHHESSLKRFSLGEACRFFGIKREVEHRALADAKVTYLVFQKLFDLS